MLKTRILTALVLAPAAIALVFLVPEWIFRLAVAILLMTGSWEFNRLANLRPPVSWVFFGIQVGLLTLMHLTWTSLSGHAAAVLIAGGVAWGLMFLRLAGYREEQEADSRFKAASFISALAAITFCWFALSWLRNQAHGEFLVLLLLIIIWAADVGAYFSGRLFGKTKLASSISPKKTWEGAIGGLLLAGIAAILMNRYAPGVEASIVSLLALTVVTVLASICGDLFISVHKRTVNLKDAGKLFPGHGGVLDRFDSLLPGSVFFALGAWILGS